MDNIQLKLGEKLIITVQGHDVWAVVSGFHYNQNKGYYWDLTFPDGNITYSVKQSLSV